MKEFKYTIDGKDYKVSVNEIDENYLASITVNDEEFKIQLEKPEKEEKKKQQERLDQQKAIREGKLKS